MQYSPKLKMAMEEIKAIISKYDIGAMITLTDEKEFTEYLNRLDPSWSAIRAEGDKVTLLVNPEHYGGDKEKRNKAVAATLGMLDTFIERSGITFMQYENLAKQLKDQNIDWHSARRGPDTSHTEQNN